MNGLDKPSAGHASSAISCDFCNGGVHVTYEQQKFMYGAGNDRVELTAMVPVVHCGLCEESYTGEDAEMLRHEAVCKHLGRLTPAQIKSIRERHGATQDQFARVSNFGVASIKRWESGNQIQNASVDRFLTLLSDDEVYKRAELLVEGSRPTPIFRTKLSDRTLQEAREFRLRPAVEKMAA